MFEGTGASKGRPLVSRTDVHLVGGLHRREGRNVTGLKSTLQRSGAWVSLWPVPGSVDAGAAVAGEIEAQ